MSDVINVTNEDVYRHAARVAGDIQSLTMGPSFRTASYPIKLYPVPRGGVPALYAVMHFLDHHTYAITDDVTQAHIVFDDLVDSGKTRARYTTDFPNKPFFCLYEKLSDQWIIFPWEGTEEGSASDIPTRLLQYIGEDPKRGGLKETPSRFLKAWTFWTSGYKQDPVKELKAFEDGAEAYDQLVFQGRMPFYSMCEHHLAPFFGEAYIGYIPNKKIVGLSKLNRVLEIFARRLQVQERLTQQIASLLSKELDSPAVGVVLECRHMCIESRGIERPGTRTITSAMLGEFRDDPSARAEFFRLVDLSKKEA